MTVPLDICSCLLLSFIWYFSLSLCCKVCPRYYSKWLISSPDTSDRSPEVTIVLEHSQIPTSVLYLSSEDNLISSFVDCARIFSHPQIGHCVGPLFTQLVHMRSDIGPGLFQRSLNTGYNWSPQYVWRSWHKAGKRIICKTSYLKKNVIFWRDNLTRKSRKQWAIYQFRPNLTFRPKFTRIQQNDWNRTYWVGFFFFFYLEERMEWNS